MKCPSCGHSDDRVLDTREQKDGQSIRRRRECLQCRARFSTVESVILSYPFVIKKDGRREPFNREKLIRGLQAACQKRPIGLSQLEAIADRLSQWIAGVGERDVPSATIGAQVMRELRTIDNVAYVRFASVYKNFRDLQEFVEGLDHTTEKSLATSACEPSQLSFVGERIVDEKTGPGISIADSLPT